MSAASSGRRPDLYGLFSYLRAWAAADYPGDPPRRITIEMASGERLVLPVPCDTTHSPDFRSVRWQGVDYQFSEAQARAVKLLWEARQAGSPDLGGGALLAAADSEGYDRVRDLFKDHPAWNKLIVANGKKGVYRLADDFLVG